MSRLDHFAIAANNDREKFKTLVEWSKNMDSDDFLPSGYFVDENLHPVKGIPSDSPSGKRASSSWKGKRKAVVVTEVASKDEEEVDTTVDIAREGGEAKGVWIDPISQMFPNTSDTAFELDDLPKPSGVRGSSDMGVEHI